MAFVRSPHAHARVISVERRALDGRGDRRPRACPRTSPDRRGSRSSTRRTRCSRTARCATSVSRSRRSWPTARALAEDAADTRRGLLRAARGGDRPACRRDARALGEARGRRRGRVRGRRARRPHRARDPAAGGGADGAARRARGAGRRPVDRLVVVAERAPPARAAGADPRPRAERRSASSSRTSAARFGSKGTLPVETPLVALAALELGRPVRWTEDRHENFLSAPQGRGLRAAVELAFDADGRILALRGAAARRPRRLPAAQHADPAAHDGDAAGRLLRHPERRGVRHRRAHEQGADRPVPRCRPARGELPDRDDARRRRARARDRPGRAAPPQPGALVPVPDRARLDVRLRRLRALPGPRASS